MARYVSFRTNRFNSKIVKPHFINPETGFGEDVVEWLIQEIHHPAITLDSPIQEDYGWGVWASVNGAPYWIAASLTEDATEESAVEWSITIVYERGCNRLRRVPPARSEDLLILSRAIDSALYAEPAISNIQWWRQDFQDGQPSTHPD